MARPVTFADIERLTRQADALRKRIDATYELLRGAAGISGGTGESHDPVTLGSGSDPALTLTDLTGVRATKFAPNAPASTESTTP